MSSIKIEVKNPKLIQAIDFVADQNLVSREEALKDILISWFELEENENILEDEDGSINQIRNQATKLGEAISDKLEEFGRKHDVMVSLEEGDLNHIGGYADKYNVKVQL